MTAIYLRGRGHRLALLMFALFAAHEASADNIFAPYASEQFEHNNNVFSLPNSSTAVTVGGDPQLGDSDQKTVAGFIDNYRIDQQVLYATLEGRYQDFDHYTYLNHYEYFARLGFDWTVDKFGGTLMGTQERVMAAFADRDTATELAVNVDRHLTTSVNYQVAPEWKLEGGVDFHHELAPVEDYPDFTLTESFSHVSLKYVGFANLSYGLRVNYIDGKYENAPVDVSYIQRDFDFTVAYNVSALSAFNGAIGYTDREQSGGQPGIPAVTGSLGYFRRLTGKTTLNVAISRNANSYIAGGSAELDTGGTISVTFQPTYKTGITASISDTYSKFVGQTLPGTDTAGRRDHTPSASLKVNYQVTRWVLIQPFASYTRRSSNEDFYEFSDTIMGIKVLVQKPVPANVFMH
jgi:hypothetical protein